MKAIITLLLIISNLTNAPADIDNKSGHIWWYIRNAMDHNHQFSDSRKGYLTTRYLMCINKYTRKYNLKKYRVRITKQIKGESWFNPFAVGDNGQSHGSAQIKIKYFSNDMYKLDNGRLGDHFRELTASGKKINYAKYLQRIGYNVELQCMIMSNLLVRYEGNYAVALLAYGSGPSGKLFKKYRYSPEITNVTYISNILL